MMLDVRCVYHNTIALHTCDHQFLVIGSEIGRAQQYASAMDLIVRYDSSVHQYGHMMVRDNHDHLTFTHHNKVMIYDKGISDHSSLPDYANIVLLDLSHKERDIIPLLQHMKPWLIVIMPTIDQESAIRHASDIMRQWLTVPKYLKEWQYVSVEC